MASDLAKETTARTLETHGRPVPTASRRGPCVQPTQPLRVLIAEDEEISARILEQTVAHLGHVSHTARDGADAWAWFLTHDPDVVISDWMMPEIDGLELCRRVRGATSASYTYFILLTAMAAREDRLEGMLAGADDYLTKPLDSDDLKLRLVAAERVTGLHSQLLQHQRELERVNQMLWRDGRRDALTGVGNRLLMVEDLTRLQASVTRYGQIFSVALFDIDYFKSYNDSCGHIAGDQALRHVAQVLDAQCRRADAVYRYGGEEFLLVYANQGSAEATRAADRMRRAVEASALLHPGRSPRGPITVSAGVATSTAAESLSVDELLRRADAALYAAKRRGRNCTMSYESPAD